jgi:hypothetical protein
MANKAPTIHDPAIGAAAKIMFRYGIEHQHNPAIKQPRNDHNDQQQTKYSNAVTRACIKAKQHRKHKQKPETKMAPPCQNRIPPDTHSQRAHAYIRTY